MILRSKFTIKDGTNAGNLLVSFFEDFHEESMISVKGKYAEVRMVFETEPPMHVVKAIRDLCDEDLEFCYNEDISKLDVTHEPAKLSEEAEQVETPKPVEEAKQAKKAANSTSQIQKKDGKHKLIYATPSDKAIIVNKINEVISEASSIEEVALAITNWINPTEQKKSLVNLCVLASVEMDSFDLESLSAVFAKNNCTLSPAILAALRYNFNKLAKKLRVRISFLPFLKVIKEVTLSKFPPEAEISEAETSEAESSESDITKEVKSLDPLENVLNSLDQYSSVSDCVQHIASELNFTSIPHKEREDVLSILNAALRVKEVTDDSIAKEVSISTNDYLIATMHIATKVNGFYSRHGFNKKIHAMDFLKLLRDSISTSEKLS